MHAFTCPKNGLRFQIILKGDEWLALALWKFHNHQGACCLQNDVLRQANEFQF
ncbi:hypothetical protein SLEP1_g54991 [Rubroshorea leprosula]|uniref:Uncharacterized protein n=1 Tax=Rubroshorea leprosula TaxID=152421 RepID=A0AAV5MF64_9ROSI|nr:hypothetical protein SLEP1_g54991 [Rubroshorea leprosula]